MLGGSVKLKGNGKGSKLEINWECQRLRLNPLTCPGGLTVWFYSLKKIKFPLIQEHSSSYNKVKTPYHKEGRYER